MAVIIPDTSSRDISILFEAGACDVEDIAVWSSDDFLHRQVAVYPAGDHSLRSRANPHVVALVLNERDVRIFGCTGAQRTYRPPPPYTGEFDPPPGFVPPDYTIRLDAEAAFEISDATDAKLVVTSYIAIGPELIGIETENVAFVELTGPGGVIYSHESSISNWFSYPDETIWPLGRDGLSLELSAGEYRMRGYTIKPRDTQGHYVQFAMRVWLPPDA